ncbi:MAG TPA: CopD family protein [Solirubrobacteraceae bacterium]|jgi:copper transport protein|nr:CopD family protein [Solirubrobacteraceae bacterium]
MAPSALARGRRVVATRAACLVFPSPRTREETVPKGLSAAAGSGAHEPTRASHPNRASSRRARASLAALLVAFLALLCWAPAALAHAQLVGSSPASGTTVRAQPSHVVFEFDEPVGGTLGAVRVYDAHGAEVDDLQVGHPQGHASWMGVQLKPGLPDGTYTATYRVISADTHIVYGGLVFNIGHASGASNVTVSRLLERGDSGRVTKLAFGVVRALDYLSIALALGGLAFLFVAWLPGLLAVAAADAQWLAASRAFAERMQRMLCAAVVLGIVVSVLGVLLQGASAAGVSLWASLKGAVVQGTLESRFGIVWAACAVDWLLIGGLMLGARALRRPLVPALRREQARGAAGRSPSRAPASAQLLAAAPSRWLLALLALGGVDLAITPALAGHASIESPVGVFFASDVLHALAASVWVGGIACLLIALPAATRELAGPDRSRLLLATLARFSPLALAAVIAIAITGVVEAYIDVRSVHGLLHSTYGVLILAKVALLLALVALGYVNRERVLPALRRVAHAHLTPGDAGVLARRTMRGELALMLGVFAVTAALISYTPPIDATAGPFSTNATIGAAELEMTVEPAEAGVNTAHLYLIDARTGAQFTATKELTVTASLPSKGIGPLALRATLAGPGHYVLNSAVLSPAGTWDIRITDRVSEFEQHTRTVEVPIARPSSKAAHASPPTQGAIAR